MVDIRKFKGVRPKNQLASRISSLPYDVVDTQGAREMVEVEPLSFMRIDRAEVNFKDLDFNDVRVYDKAKDLILQYLDKGYFMVDGEENIYIYELTFRTRTQYGIVCLSSVEDYLNKDIKIHEYTLPEKEEDRTNHIDITNYHTGPIFLLYRKDELIDGLVKDTVNNVEPEFDFTTKDRVRHRGFIVREGDKLVEAFKSINSTYIADGHHRCKSAINVYNRRKEEGRLTEGSKHFLSVIFPTDEVEILAYNRHIEDLGGLGKEEFLKEIERYFILEKIPRPKEPEEKFQTVVYMKEEAYLLSLKDEYRSPNILERLDATVVQNYIFDRILGIKDPRRDKRLDFIGGIHEVDYLVNLVDEKGGLVFIMYPTRVDELLEVADNNLIMPPKSTWFEPKLHSGLFLHQL